MVHCVLDQKFSYGARNTQGAAYATLSVNRRSLSIQSSMMHNWATRLSDGKLSAFGLPDGQSDDRKSWICRFVRTCAIQPNFRPSFVSKHRLPGSPLYLLQIQQALTIGALWGGQHFTIGLSTDCKWIKVFIFDIHLKERILLWFLSNFLSNECFPILNRRRRTFHRSQLD